jgi:pimeloyl-ACP methyl ester carboxylesterase
MSRRLLNAIVLCAVAGTAPALAAEIGDDGYLESGGVRLHYVTAGEGPLVVLLHGFPDYWYTWRDQIPALARYYRVVALDLRGYNLSDQPEGVENYTLEKLVGDVAATAAHFGRERVTLVGHDWGGAIAWGTAMQHTELVERLVVLNLPHPRGITRELATNPQQQKNSQYARTFQQPGTADLLQPELLAGWVKEPDARKKYVAALARSSREGMLNYYKANYPREPYAEKTDFPPVKCPVLLMHGLDDPALLPGALNDTWKWVEKELTLVTVPGAGHFVQQDAAGLVSQTMRWWLLMRAEK